RSSFAWHCVERRVAAGVVAFVLEEEDRERPLSFRVVEDQQFGRRDVFGRPVGARNLTAELLDPFLGHALERDDTCKRHPNLLGPLFFGRPYRPTAPTPKRATRSAPSAWR